MTTKNPWRGLASYEEPQGRDDDYMFCGRDEETMDVVRLIDNNLFITLYGSSGIGKTSLLKAGVMPILKRRNYHPVYIRLSQEPTEIPYAEAIVRKLVGSGLREERSVEMEHGDGNDRMYLWNYFAITRFLNDEGQEVYPVIILDQFEEVFRDTDKTKAELLLQQVYLLLNDELEIPCQEGYSADTNYRFVASLREDFLFVLEDSIDGLSMDLLKNNRYRLRPMKPENARQVVMIPGKGCIEPDHQSEIADQVVSLAERNSHSSIDTLLLSLICSEMYLVAEQGQGIITKSMIEQLGDNILSSFYKRAMSEVSPRTAEYLESHLLTQSGFRNSIAMEDILHDGIDKADIDKLIEKRLLRTEHSKGFERIEFTHDALCSMAKSSRDLHVEKEERKDRISHYVGFCFDLLFPVLLSISTMKAFISWSDSMVYVIVAAIIIIALFIASAIILPYRHSRDQNVKWALILYTCCFIFTLTALEILVAFISSGQRSSADELIFSSFYIFTYIGWINTIYLITRTVVSFTYNKKKSLKESLRYIFTFKAFKEFPVFKIILPISIALTILLLIFGLSFTYISSFLFSLILK